MSYSITIYERNTDKVCETNQPHNILGATYCPESTRLEFNITFNYKKFYTRPNVLGDVNNEGLPDEKLGIKSLSRYTVPEARVKVFSAIQALKDQWLDADGNPAPDVDKKHRYWAATESNARQALIRLLALLLLAPDDARIEVTY